MPESRDRLTRPVDIAAMYLRRRSGALGILDDQVDELFRSPIRQVQNSPEIVRTPALSFVASAGRTRGSGFRGRRSNQSRSLGRRGNRVLPSWYPRRPLQDITVVARAMEERRRARLREGVEDRGSDSPVQDLAILEESVSDQSAQLEQNEVSLDIITPRTALKTTKHYPNSVGKVPNILLGIANQNYPEAMECLTPQKKLLNSIDTVQKVVMEELQKLKATPAAKRAERDRRVRTLMSMR